MPFRLATISRDDACDAIVDLIDVGGTGTIQIRTGAQPTTPQDAATGTLLATLTFSATAFGDSSSGTASANAINSDTDVAATGVAGYARILNGGGNAVFDMDIGEGSGTLSFDDTNFVAGGTAAISSMDVTVNE